MNIESDKARLSLLYNERYGLPPAGITPLAAGGSSRRYYLLAGNGSIPDIVGTCGDDARENRAFIYLARHFRAKDLDVPEIICEDAGQSAYLQSYISGNRYWSVLVVRMIIFYLKGNAAAGRFPLYRKPRL